MSEYENRLYCIDAESMKDVVGFYVIAMSVFFAVLVVHTLLKLNIGVFSIMFILTICTMITFAVSECSKPAIVVSIVLCVTYTLLVIFNIV